MYNKIVHHSRASNTRAIALLLFKVNFRKVGWVFVEAVLVLHSGPIAGRKMRTQNQLHVREQRPPSSHAEQRQD
jgi:hypothetical protein